MEDDLTGKFCHKCDDIQDTRVLNVEDRLAGNIFQAQYDRHSV